MKNSNLNQLKKQFQLIQKIRNFFLKENFTDVITPPMVQNPGMEVHIHPFKVSSLHLQSSNSHQQEYFLQTSPEFHMKELLSYGFENIFTINYSFRDEPSSPIHRKQFLMLEWYRAHQGQDKIIDDCIQLIHHCLNSELQLKIPITIKTVQEIFLEILNIDILEYLELEKLRNLIVEKFPSVPLPPLTAHSKINLKWDDYYFLLFLNCIEPKLSTYPVLIIKDFPEPLKALAKIKASNPKVALRHELFIYGIEVANCYEELTDFNEQERRINLWQKEKSEIYNYQLPYPEVLMDSLKRGLPPSAGIAMGIERLLLGLEILENPLLLKALQENQINAPFWPTHQELSAPLK